MRESSSCSTFSLMLGIVTLLMAICISSLVKCLSKSFTCLLIELLFLSLICRNSLYILVGKSFVTYMYYEYLLLPEELVETADSLAAPLEILVERAFNQGPPEICCLAHILLGEPH